MKSSNKVFMLLISLIFVTGCQGSDADKNTEKDTEPPSVSVTQWTDKMELFMEYPIPVESKPGKFVIHLTTLSDFKPVREGKVILNFRHESGRAFQVVRDSLLREGIFNPVVTLPLSGKYLFTLDYKGRKVEDSFNIGDLIVYESYTDIPPQAEDEAAGISFLKEQQWKTDFQTEPARIKKIKSSVSAVGEVIPRQQSHAEIASPVEGIVDVKHNQNMAIPGSRVSKGEILITLSPPLNVANSWTEVKLAYQEAKSEFERAQRLMQKDAISERDYEKIERDYLTRKAGYEAYFGSDKNNGGELFELKSPVSGIVNEVSVLPGQKANVGQKLMTIVDPSMVWLKVNFFEKDYYNIDTPQGASLTVPGLSSPDIIDEGDFRLLSKGNVIDPGSRTIPVLFEVKNPDSTFKIGQVLQVELYTSDEKEALSVPSQSIYDDDGQQVVFVHKEGETFEKRVVEVGDSYKGWVEIREGLKERERVVTKGGYQVKLASSSAAIGHPHAH